MRSSARTLTFLLAACVLPAAVLQEASAQIAPILSADCEVSESRAEDFSIRRGETAIVQRRFLQNGSAVDLTPVNTVQLDYTPADPATNTTHHVVTGAVHSATGGIVRVTWTAAACAADTYYSYELAVGSDSQTLVRAFGTLTLTPGVGDAASAATVPALTTIDFATAEVRNPSSSPFLTEYETAAVATNIAALSNRVTAVEAHTNSAATAYAWGDHASAGYAASASNLADLASAAAARTNLALVVGSNVQAYDADLTDLADGSLTGTKVADTFLLDGSRALTGTFNAGVQSITNVEAFQFQGMAPSRVLKWSQTYDTLQYYYGAFPSGIVWQSYNDGAGSTLDADLLDGVDSTALLATSGARPMAGTLNMGGHSITNIGDASLVFASGASISTGTVAHWNSAYGWGDHAVAGYATDANLTVVSGLVDSVEAYTNYAATAYAWGNHASAGYLCIASNLTDLASPAAARTALGLELSVDVQPYASALDALALSDGSALVSLSASELDSGTVPLARLPAVASNKIDWSSMPAGLQDGDDLGATTGQLAAVSVQLTVVSGLVDEVEAYTNEAHTAYGWGNHASAGYAAAANLASVSGQVNAVEAYTNYAATAYGWGNHATEGYSTTGQLAAVEANLASVSGQVDEVEAYTNEAHTAYGWGNHASAGYAAAANLASVSGQVDAVEAYTNEAHLAYGWGNHASAGYATGTPVYVEGDTLDDVMDRQNSTDRDLVFSATRTIRHTNDSAYVRLAGGDSAAVDSGAYITLHGIGSNTGTGSVWIVSSSNVASRIRLYHGTSNVVEISDAQGLNLHDYPLTNADLSAYAGTALTWTNDTFTAPGLAVVSARVTVVEGYTSTWAQAATDATGWTNSPAAGLTHTHTQQLATAYAWGNHATNGYLDRAIVGASKLIYTDAASNVTELALGAANSYLKSSGAHGTPGWGTVTATATNLHLADLLDTATNNYLPMGNGTNLVLVTPAQAHTNLGLIIGSNVQAHSAVLTCYTTNQLVQLLDDDGAGSGLDADLLDGYNTTEIMLIYDSVDSLADVETNGQTLGSAMVWSNDILRPGLIGSNAINWATMPTGLQDGDDSGTGGGIGTTTPQLAVDSCDWYGWQSGEGPTTNNALVYIGDASAVATNPIDAAWCAYSAASSLQSKYSYAFAAAPGWAECVGASGVTFLVKSDNVSTLTNRVDVFFGDASAYTNRAGMVSTVANQWTAYTLPAAQLPAAWTSGLPHSVQGGHAVNGLSLLAAHYTSHSNKISMLRVLVHWGTL